MLAALMGARLLGNMVFVRPVSLVLLPGLDGTGLLFEPLLAELPAAITPTIVRYPGDRHLTYEDLVPLAVEALPRSGRFILLGESFSGPLATMIASKRPEGLIGLILCAMFVTSPRRFVRPAIRILARGPLFHLYLPYKRLRAWFGGFADLRSRALLDEMAELVRPDVIASRVRMVFGVDAMDALRLCEVPMLYLQGRRDRVVPRRNLRVIQGIHPDIQVVTVGSSHMVLQRQAAAAAGVISRFAAMLDAREG